VTDDPAVVTDFPASGLFTNQHTVSGRFAVEEWGQDAGDHQPGSCAGPEQNYDANENSIAHANYPSSWGQAAGTLTKSRQNAIAGLSQVDPIRTLIVYPPDANSATKSFARTGRSLYHSEGEATHLPVGWAW
jgi:hypothetical protein